MLHHEFSSQRVPRFILSHVGCSLPARKKDFLLIHFAVTASICSLLEYLVFPSWKSLQPEMGEAGWIKGE